MYRKIGEINGFSEIPWDESVIISGSIGGNRSWVQRMPGVFRKDNNDFRFVDDFGMSTRFGRSDSTSLNLLEKYKPEGESNGQNQ